MTQAATGNRPFVSNRQPTPNSDGLAIAIVTALCVVATAVGIAAPGSPPADPRAAHAPIEAAIEAAPSFAPIRRGPYRLQPAQLRCFAQTLWGEARGGSDAEVKAKAGVILRRLESGRHGSSICGVVKARKGKVYAFTVWDPRDVNFAPMQAAPSEAGREYRRMVRIAQAAQAGPYDSYWSPAAMRRLTGADTPSWGRKCAVTWRAGRSVFCRTA
jgi:spore germination cell wall hydrolase CwlJ-like protein